MGTALMRRSAANSENEVWGVINLQGKVTPVI